VRGIRRMLDRSAQAEAMHIVGEALTNVRKHAEASSVLIALEYGWRSLRLSIVDDGNGFDLALPGTAAGHWGLLGMRERASRIGGRLAIKSKPGGGTNVSIDVRYPRARKLERASDMKD
jgi:signal transduction histidine kinase